MRFSNPVLGLDVRKASQPVSFWTSSGSGTDSALGLVDHISQPDKYEFYDSMSVKEKHLGYRGAVKLIQQCQPKLTILGEFWSGLADLRLDLTKGLRQLCGTNFIFPSSRSLILDPKTLEFKCTACSRYCSYKEIHVAPAQEPFGVLSYVCDNCRLD